MQYSMRRTGTVLLLVLAVAVAGCLGSGQSAPQEPADTNESLNDTEPTNDTAPPEQETDTFEPHGGLTLSSPVFSDGGPLPASFTCDGQDRHPQFDFDGLPRDTASLAMIMDDPDAPGGVFTHWLVWNIPAVNTIAAGSNVGVAARNDFGTIGYNGPCPPLNETHTYRFRGYALDTELALNSHANRSQLEAAMDGRVLAADQIMATYSR